MKKFFDILKNEFKTFINDHGVILIMVVGVVVYSLFYAVPYANEVVKEAPIAVVDLDQTSFSREFVRNLDVTDYVKVVEKLPSLKEAQKKYYEGEISGFAIIPKDFQKDIYRGKQVDLSLYVDSAYLIIYKAIYTGVMQTALETGARVEIGRLVKMGVPKQTALALKQPFQFVQIPLYNPAGGYETYVYPVILIMILHQTLIVALGMLQGTRNEKKIRYCKNDKEIPITLFARTTFYVLLYFLYGAFIFLICPALCRYPMCYNVLPLFVLYGLMLYAAAFFVQVISYGFRIREASLMVLVVTSLVFIFLPGIIWPKEAIPQIVNVISMFIPVTPAIDGITKVNVQGATFYQVLPDFLCLLFLCVLYFVLAIFVTKKLHKEYEK